MTGVPEGGGEITVNVPRSFKIGIGGVVIAAGFWAANMSKTQTDMAADIRVLRETMQERINTLRERVDRVESHNKS